ncbi:MAG: hypothetical protein GEV03_17720 [Streptosporangiales bacterium]|nr:hypothetical protein [Streptosporangiales bacterium]
MDLETVVGELYGLRPEEFVAAREERAKQARSDGDRDLARRIHELRKPTMSAWAVNLLVRERAEDIDRLLDLGERLREAQSALQGDELRTLSRQRTQVVSALARQGRRLAHEAGHPIGEAAEREVAGTLEAALADPDAAEAVRSGRLATALSYSGLGAVDISGAVAAPAPRSSGERERPSGKQPARGGRREATPDRRRAEIEQGRRDLADAEDEARRFEQSEDEARRREEEARSRQEAADERVMRPRDELDRARQAAASAAGELHRASRRRERAERDTATARRRVERARARLDRLRE